VKHDSGSAAAGAPVPVLVGWKEYAALPEWGLRRLKVKIDTGARTSALDVSSYELHHSPEAGIEAEFRLALNPRRPEKLTVVRTRVLRMVVVSNTAGMREQRPLVETELQLGPVRKRIQLTITNRASMRFRMILGRTALAGDFVVDVSKKYLLRSKK
jgi:hypothetical protein